MDRVDFYLLDSPNHEDQQRLACRLAEKAWHRGHRVFIRTESAAAAAQLDDLLWTFRADSFIPHAVFSSAAGAGIPVLVGVDVAPTGPLGVLINLHASVPVAAEQCTRLAEVVGPDKPSRDSARRRYRLYREQGCALHYHTL
jgi:DNA polymerase-3 subunit chi